MNLRRRVTCLLAFILALGPALTALARSTTDTKNTKDKQREADPTPDWPEEIKQRNAEMKRRVDAWLKDGRPANMPLHVMYFSCSDQQPFPRHRDRLNRVLTEIQTWFADQNESLGFGRTTFDMERDKDGKVLLHEAKLPFAVNTRSFKNTRQTRDTCFRIAKELLAKHKVDFNTAFILMLTTIPDDHGAAPFFGHPQQTRGTCFAVDTPWLDSNYTQKTGPKVWKGRRVGPANSALIGGIAHEQVHGFGLYHCDEHQWQKKFGESLMGSGNYTWRQEKRKEGKGSFLLASDAMQLISRPPFARRIRDFERKPKATLTDVKVEVVDSKILGSKVTDSNKGETMVRVTGSLNSDVPVHGIRLYEDPPGNKDYNAVAHIALPDEKTGRFELTFTPLTAKGQHELRLYAYHVNGRWTRWRNTFAISSDRKIDLSKTETRWK